MVSIGWYLPPVLRTDNLYKGLHCKAVAEKVFRADCCLDPRRELREDEAYYLASYDFLSVANQLRDGKDSQQTIRIEAFAKRKWIEGLALITTSLFSVDQFCRISMEDLSSATVMPTKIYGGCS